MLQGFKQFMLRGNVLDLAVAVVMGAAFGAVATALVKDLITPLIAAIIGKPDFSAIEFTINSSKFLIGDFINAIVSFILIGAAVYFFIVLPMNKLLGECGAAKLPPTRPLKNARNASATCRSRRAVAPSAPRRSAKLPNAKERTADYPRFACEHRRQRRKIRISRVPPTNRRSARSAEYRRSQCRRDIPTGYSRSHLRR